jgi:hypothetical protein
MMQLFRSKAIPARTGAFVYAAQAGPLNGIGDTAQFKMADDGRLVSLKPPTVTGKGAPDYFSDSVNVNPAGTYLFVENATPPTTSEYKIACNGTIALNATLNFESFAMAFAHKGRLAIVTNTAGVNSYTLSSSGNFKLVNMVPGPGGSVAIDPTARFVYVDNESYSTISEYTVSASGVLAPLQPNNTISTLWLPFSIAMSPNGFLYSVDYGAGTVTEYSIDTSSGGPHKRNQLPNRLDHGVVRK